MSAEVASIFARCAASSSLRELLSGVRAFEAAGSPTRSHATNIRLAITGNYSTQFLAKGFPLTLAARDVRAALYESAYNQWQLELRDLGSALYAFKPTHILILLTSIDLAYSSPRSIEGVTSSIVAAVEEALKGSEACIFLTLPEPLNDEISDNSGAYVWRQRVLTGLRSTLVSPRVTLIDLDPLVRTIGTADWYDDRFYDTSKLPFHPDRTSAVLARLSDAVAGTVSSRCKLMIVDLDDTMWGGRVGDDGWEGIKLSPADTGRHFLRLQAFLKTLQDAGVILAIASKNNLQPVRDAFERRAEMMLRFEDFAAHEIHWEPKSDSVGRILARLNLSTAGVVFLDDNPVERAEVARRFPDILVPELPDNPADRVPMLISSGIFDRRVTTDESRVRHRLYAENAQRDAALQKAVDIKEFLRELEMVMELTPGAHHRERVLELMQKTNQFNLTTRRHNWAELTAATRGGFVQCYRLRDKFGDNGIISVVAVSRDTVAEARIDVWLMSCRVLGRKVEEAILHDVATRARALGARTLVGEYIATSKNEIVRELYPRLGFAELSRDGDRFVYVLSLADEHVTSASEFIRTLDRSPVEA